MAVNKKRGEKPTKNDEKPRLLNGQSISRYRIF